MPGEGWAFPTVRQRLKTTAIGVEAEDGECVACDLCGADDPIPLLHGPDRQMGAEGVYHLVQCRSCGLVYQNPRPRPEAMSRFYPDDYSPFVTRRRRLVARVDAWPRDRDERQLRRLLGRAGRLLEVGCAGGDYLAAMQGRGWQVTGVEPAERAAEAARQRGLAVHTGDLESAAFPAESFDVIVLRHVLEHDPSPSATLAEIRRILVARGTLLLLLPNYDSLERRLCGPFWHGYDLPRHLYDLTPATLAALLEKAGLRLLSLKHTVVPTSYVWSLRYWCQARGYERLARFFRSDNLLAIGLFLPLGLLGAGLHRAGRIQAVAEKG